MSVFSPPDLNKIPIFSLQISHCSAADDVLEDVAADEIGDSICPDCLTTQGSWTSRLTRTLRRIRWKRSGKKRKRRQNPDDDQTNLSTLWMLRSIRWTGSKTSWIWSKKVWDWWEAWSTPWQCPSKICEHQEATTSHDAGSGGVQPSVLDFPGSWPGLGSCSETAWVPTSVMVAMKHMRMPMRIRSTLKMPSWGSERPNCCKNPQVCLELNWTSWSLQ